MPNHVAQTLSIECTDEEHEVLLAAITSQYEEHGETETLWLDFNRIIPMPLILEGTEKGSESDMGRVALTGEGWQQERYAKIVREAGITSADEFRAWVKKHRPNAIEEGAHSLAAEAATGFSDWYDWSWENWGTKWPAYYTSMRRERGVTTIWFSTAWNKPTPILLRLSEMFPNLRFEHSYYDEGSNFWGTAAYVGGAMVEERHSKPEDQDELCLALQGYLPGDDEDEDEDEAVA